MAAPEARDWQSVAAPRDQERIQQLPQTWQEAIRQLRSRGFARRLREEGALLDPRAAQPRAQPAPGPYRCRLVRLTPGPRPLVAHRPYFCHVVVEGDLLSLTKEDGSERPGGYLWPDGDGRQVFLGAVAVGRERLPPPYRDDPERDLVGVLERIGTFRYRLVMPRPPSGATLDILELTPVVSDPDF